MVAPVAVSAPSSSESRISPMTAGTPPAWWNRSIRYSPEGLRLARNGTSRESSSKRSSGRSMPSRPAIAGRWMTAFVEPPSACSVAIALWNAAGVRICESRRSSCTICTMRRPVMWASARRRESAAGIAAAPVSVVPSASAIDVIVLAVPIVLQWPSERE